MPTETPMSTIRKPPAHLLMAVVCLSVVGACTKDPVPRAEPVRPVRTVVVQPQSSLTVLNLPGEVRPRLETRYGFRVGGKVAERKVSVGDRVRAGTVLARLDPQDLAPQVAVQQAQLEAARTELKLAQIDAKRTRDLRERNFVSQSSTANRRWSMAPNRKSPRPRRNSTMPVMPRPSRCCVPMPTGWWSAWRPKPARSWPPVSR